MMSAVTIRAPSLSTICHRASLYRWMLASPHYGWRLLYSPTWLSLYLNSLTSLFSCQAGQDLRRYLRFQLRISFQQSRDIQQVFLLLRFPPGRVLRGPDLASQNIF